MRGIENGSARGFIYAAGLHTDQTVFNHVAKPHAIFSAHFIQLFEEGNTVHLHAVDRCGNSLFEMNGDIRRLIGRRPRRYAEFAYLIVIGLVCGVLEIEPLMREVPKVFIFGIIGFARNLQRNVMRFRILDFLFAALDIPHAPGRDNLHFGRKRFDRQLETHLIVSFARTAVTNGVSALFLCDFHETLGDDGTGKGRSQQIFVLVFRPRLYGGINIILDKFFFQIFYVELGRTCFQSLFLQALQLRFLSYVGGNGDNLGVSVIFFQPRNDDGRIKSARIRKHDFFEGFFLFHDECSCFSDVRDCLIQRGSVLFIALYYTTRNPFRQAYFSCFCKKHEFFCIYRREIFIF